MVNHGLITVDVVYLVYMAMEEWPYTNMYTYILEKAIYI